MALKLNVGISKKVGLPDYGSLGTFCNVEVEVDSSLIFVDLDAFHQKVRQAYVACSQAVKDELARQTSSMPTSSQSPTAPNNGNSAMNGNCNGNGHSKAANGSRVSQKQLNYANQLAGQIPGLGIRRLEPLANEMFGLPLAGLSSCDASSLIDTLKAIKDGRLELDGAFQGESQ
jgi:hypothetical protein